jgi:choline kinase
METALPLPVSILAAGEGTRLRGVDEKLPKPCMPLHGATIAEWSLNAFYAAGVREFRVGLGFKADMVRNNYLDIAERLGIDIEFVTVQGWEKGNGVTALALARSFSPRPFLLSMADHLFSPQMIRYLIDFDMDADKITLAVDPFPGSIVDLDDLTKVQTEAGHVVAIGKELTSWDAGDSGLFYCTKTLAEGLETAQANSRFSLSDGVRHCASKGLVLAATLPGPRMWIDIDTPDDLRLATSDARDLLTELSVRSTSD